MIAPVTPRRVVSELRNLRMQQAAAARLLPILDDPLVGAKEVAEIIETDPAMTARVLRLANSAFLGVQNPVVSAAHAVTVIGFSVVRSVAVSTAAGLFEGRRSTLPTDFWGHSVRVAAASALCGPVCEVSRGDAFSAGLLHDIGQALMFRFDPPNYRQLLLGVEVDSEVHLKQERRSFGMNHAELGALALEEWKLPAELVEATAEHHRGVSVGVSNLRKTVVLGEHLGNVHAAKDPTSRGEARQALARSAREADVTMHHVDELLLELQSDIDHLRGLLSAM